MPDDGHSTTGGSAMDAIVAQWTTADGDADAWSRVGIASARQELVRTCGKHMHATFYGEMTSGARGKGGGSSTRGTNKFLEMEAQLLRGFQALSSHSEAVGSSEAFWTFAVELVLWLASEDSAQLAIEAPTAPQQPDTGKKSKKKPKGQPFVPLAFLVVNALHKMISEGTESMQTECRVQGSRHAELRQFCVEELKSPTFIDHKLLIEIIELFGVSQLDDCLIQQEARYLVDIKSHAALIKLCSTFRSVDWVFTDLLCALISSKDWASAELLVRTFDDPSTNGELSLHQVPTHAQKSVPHIGNDVLLLARFLVEEAIRLQEFKRGNTDGSNSQAHKIVFQFSLQTQFPDVDLLYSRDGLMKLVEKQRWQMALTFVGSDATLQRLLLDHMVAAGVMAHARALAERMGMVDFEPENHELQLPVRSVAPDIDSADCLKLSLLRDTVIMCDNDDSVQAAADFLLVGSDPVDPRYSRVIGLDVEWKPTSSKICAATGSITTTAIASILQIASSSRVFMVDLLSLHESSALFSLLGELFTRTDILKVGFGFDTDLKVLHQTFPEQPCFRMVSPFLELSSAIFQLLGTSVGNSLSHVTTRLLGKPLDKRMQMSNWDDRPLSVAQLEYAALDAFCLVQIVEQTMTPSLTSEEPITWKDLSNAIGALSLSSPLGDQAATEAIALRHEYHTNWVERHRAGTSKTPLISSEDVASAWHSRKMAAAAKGVIGGELQFLPLAEGKALLEEREGQRQTYRAINSICLFIDGQPSIACIDAKCKLDTAQLAILCGVGRRKVKLATAMECEETFGFAPGTVPPFGHRLAHLTKIYADESLERVDYWVCGSGSIETLLIVPSPAFFQIMDVETGDISIHRSNEGDSIDSASSRALSGPIGNDGSQQEEFKFLADSMVGRVGRWLRTIGIDVIIWDPTTAPRARNGDHKGSLLSLAAKEQRILLTRDKKLADRRDAGACFVVSSDNPYEQFQEIKAHFALQLKKEEMMSRCAKCNGKGFTIVTADYVRQQTDDEVHERVLEVVNEFWICNACKKVYWEGPKYSSAYENMVHMFDDVDVVDKNAVDTQSAT
ncbi:TPA: LOW QUALITY PROTEIN: hypothetical protein N0F65_007062 [Lagenidium giganteum]|uniref:3'-5' exonuclease domain-containing protein n=1 Tax=Lagenidium giganteum TaxID=4803 RepID=A0AAV2YTS6_9STRA|nr:TPA: LOW QUALITY PROTEIN: hypothetical protein N0F65_007062 [Lagenidium giganteum]